MGARHRVRPRQRREVRGYLLPALAGNLLKPDLAAAAEWKDVEPAIFDFTYAPEFRSAAFSVIKSDVSGYAVFQAKRSLWSLISNRYEYLLEVVIKNELPSVYAKMPIPLLLAIGMMFWLCVYILVFVALKDKKLRPWWLFFASLVAVNALISGGINPAGSEMSRYSLPFLASLFMFAGVGARVLARFART